MIKQYFLTLLFSTFSFIGFSQTYSDDFNNGVTNATTWNSISTSIHNQSLRLTGNGTSGAWTNINYSLNNSGNNINVDASVNPKLFLKIKATNSPRIRIDFIDVNGNVTNQNHQSIYPTPSFQIFEIDYTNKFISTGSCTPGPCLVDSTQLAGLMIFVQPGIGSYFGEIDIDWISIGAPLEVLAEYDIRYNQVGYFTNKEKIFNIASTNDFSPKAYIIADSSGNVIMSDSTSTATFWSDSQEYIARADVSIVTTPGYYQFITDSLEVPFKIGATVYDSISEAVLKYFYFHRASTSIDSSYGGDFARNMGHEDTQVLVHSSAASATRPTGTIISASKGWYDAGDYNKYVSNSGLSTYSLLTSYEHYKSYYQTKTIAIPETVNNVPDILDEIKWNLDWMLAMQDPNDGGVYHKLTGLSFSSLGMPEFDALDRYVVQKSTTATLNFAGVMAVASRIYAEYENEMPGYSSALLNASEFAYTWAKNNPTAYYLSNPTGISTGVYSDNDVSDEFQWAATELFITTLDSQYKNDIDISTIGGGVSSWRYKDPAALISLTFHKPLLAQHLDITLAETTLLTTANSLKSHFMTSIMNITMGHYSNDFRWGSNGIASKQIIILIRAYEITGDDSYLDIAYTAMDYLFGRNGTGYCYVTGFGNKSPENPHHNISKSDVVVRPIPGMLVGGPNFGQEDVQACNNAYPNNFNASSYIDSYCSYASNEVAINWNAPLAYVVNALKYYEDQAIISLGSVDYTEREITIYPNPTNDVINIKSNNLIIHSIKIYDITGREVNGINYTNNSTAINLAELENNIYFIIFNTSNGAVTKKIIKQ